MLRKFNSFIERIIQRSALLGLLCMLTILITHVHGTRKHMANSRGFACLLCCVALQLEACKASHKWVSLRDVQELNDDAPSVWQSPERVARQLLVSMRARMRARRSLYPRDRERSSTDKSAPEETRLPIFVIGLRHREEERMAKFLVKLRWFEDLYIVDAVDGRTIDPVGTMTSGEVIG